MRYTKNIRTLLSLSIGLAVMAGCDSTNSTQGDLSTASLSFQVPANTIMQKTTADTLLRIESAKIYLRSIQFHSGLEDSSEHEMMDDDSIAVKSDPTVVNLDLTGNTNSVVVTEIPSGTYKRVSFRLHKPENSETVLDSDFVEGTGGNQRFSVVVQGSYDGINFTYKSRRTANQHVDIEPPIVITDTVTFVNVTMLVDVNSWFMDSDSTMLNPSDSSNFTEIDNAIVRSFKAIKDNNHNGCRDDED